MRARLWAGPPTTMQTLHVLGLDHTVASVSVREMIAFSKQEIVLVLPELLGGPAGVREAMMLCTCNRTEVYLVTPGPLTSYPLEPLQRLRPDVPILDDRLQRYVFSNLQGVEHLFAVASSLRSQLPGDTQISRQLANAVQLARTAGTSGPYLNRAVDSALRCAKLVRSSTGLSAGGDSLGAEVMRILKARFPRSATIVVSGTGALAMEILGVLSRVSSHSPARGRLQLRGVWSSSSERGKSCAETFGISALSDTEFAQSLASIDALVMAGAGPHPIVRPNLLQDRRLPLFILDLGLPRNLASEAFPVANAIIRDIDNVQQSAAESRARRQQAMDKAHALIHVHARRFLDRATSRFQTPFRAESYRTVERLIEHMRPTAPQQASRLRVAMHRLLAEFYDEGDFHRFA